MKITCLFALLLCFSSLSAQVFDPNDPLVDYDELNAPTTPANGIPAKWVRTKRVSWNSDNYKSYIYNGIPFRMRYPNNYDPNQKYPLVLMFHGRGESGEIYDNENNLKHAARDHDSDIERGYFNGFVIFPQNTTGFWSNVHMTAMHELLENELSSIGVDLDRIVVHGLSAGGQGTWKYISLYPGDVAAALPMSAASINFIDDIDQYKHVPIWLSQGGRDKAPTPGTSSYLRDEIVAKGGNIRYTLYKNLGHGVWNTHYNESDFWPYILRANRTNPVVMSGDLALVSTSSSKDVFEFIGRNEICPGDPIEVKMGVTAGFESYEWRKDGVIIPGAISNEYNAVEFGTYDVRFRENGVWSDWSSTPIVVAEKQITETPDIAVSGLNSKVIPAPNGSSSVPLELPEGYVAYEWRLEGSTTVLGNERIFSATSPGRYVASVQEAFGCSSNDSSPFTVVDAGGGQQPNSISNFVGYASSKTAITLQWAVNPSSNPATDFEIYRGISTGGEYTMIARVDANSYSYRDDLLDPDTEYFYVIRPVNEFSAAATSSEIAVKTKVDSTAPSAPTNLMIVGTGSNYISLSWDEAVDDVGVTKYEVYRDGVKSLVSSETTTTIFNLVEGQSYQFAVKARDLTGNVSAFSNVVVDVAVANGINYKFYAKDWTENYLVDLNTKSPIKEGNLPNFDISVRDFNNNYVFLFSGEIHIPTAGNYTFETRSDDGSKLYIGDYSESNIVVNNDGNHGMRYREGTYNFQEAGYYPIHVAFYQEGGGQGLQVYWKNTAHGVTSRQLIPDEAFKKEVPLPGSPPAAPTAIQASAISYEQIDLSWTDTSTDETGFQLYRATSSMGPFVSIALTQADVTTYVDTTLEPNTTYYYQVLSIGQFGPSGIASAAISTIGDINNGVAAIDNASGIGYILYSERNVFDRFSSNRPNSSNSDHLIAIKRINDAWFYDNNSNYYPLSIEDGDLILAEADFSNDNITSLEGSPSVIHGIEAGFESGDLDFYANRWNGGNNNGEFTVTGSYFNRYNKPIASATTGSLPAVPAMVSDFAIDSLGTTQIGLTWSEVMDAEEYLLSRSNDGVTFLPLENFTAGEGAYSFVDNDLEPHTLYQYAIIATNAGGESEQMVVSGTTLNSVPELSDLPSSIVVKVDAELDLQLFASDEDGDELTFTTENLPIFASLEDYGDGTGLLKISPRNTDQGFYDSLVISVADASGGSSSFSLDLTVNNNNVPVLSAIADISIGEGEEVAIPFTASDVEGTEDLDWAFDVPEFVTVTPSLDGSALLSVTPGYADAGVYSGEISVTDLEGAAASVSFNIQVDEVNPNVTAKVNFTFGTFQGDASWNNTSGHPRSGDSYLNLKDEQGNTTNFGISIASKWTNNGSNNSGTSTGDNSGVLPDNVMLTSYWTYTKPEEVLVTGLDDSKAYKLGFFGSRNANDNRTTTYTVDGASVSLDAASNTSEIVYLDVEPVAGEISILIEKGVGSTFGYLNALIIEEVYGADLAPAAPNAVTATYNSSINEVALSWNERAFNESGYNIYRAVDLGTFQLLTSLPAGTSLYSDTEVQANTNYTYRISAVNVNGESFSDEVVAAIPNVAPQVELIEDVQMTASESLQIAITAIDDTEDTITLSAESIPTFVSFSDFGDGTGSLSLNPQSADIGIYNVSITASDDKGDSSVVTFSIEITADGLHRYYVNMSGTNNFLAPSPWRNYVGSGAAGASLGNIEALESGFGDISMTFLDAWDGVNTSGMSGSTVLPNEVTRASIWVGDNASRRILLSDLDLANAYDVTFFASRNGSGNRTTEYTINGTTVSLDAAFNQDNLVTISGVVPSASGEILISARKATSASYGYINAVIVTGYQAASELSNPTNLVATPVDQSTISLSWNDNTNLETSYEIHRSTDQANGYSLLSTVASDISSYTDSSVPVGTTFYYKVRATFADATFSDFSNVSGTSTINSIVSINFNVTEAAASPWNNTNSFPDPGLIFNSLRDQNGGNTGISFEIMEYNPESGVDPSLYGFNGDNPFGMNTGGNTGVVPDNVMRSTYWMDAGRLAELRFFNLDLSQKYSFKFFASRDGGGDRTTIYTINGNSVSLNASYNTNNLVEIQNISPDENGEVVISMTAGPFASYAYLGGLIISSSNRVQETSGARIASQASVVERAEPETFGGQVLMYPNPYRTGILRIAVPSHVDDTFTLKVINMEGKAIHQENMDFQAGSDYVQLEGLESLPEGLYLVQLESEALGQQLLRLIKK